MNTVKRQRQWMALAKACAMLGWRLGLTALSFREKGMYPPGIPFTDRERQRIRHYHIGTGYLIALFCALRGYPPDPAETHRVRLQAALSGLFDDISENYQASAVESLEEYAQLADPRGLCLPLLRQLQPEIPELHRDEWRRTLLRLFQLETQNGTTDRSDEKGALAVLLFRLLLENPLQQAERDAWMTFGRYIQCCDDLFDAWSDRQQNQATPAVRLLSRGSTEALEKHFSAQLLATREAIRLTPYPAPWQDKTLAAVHFLTATTRVCVQHFKKLAKKHGTLPLDDRIAMVVDMERWTNRRRAAWHLLYESPW